MEPVTGQTSKKDDHTQEHGNGRNPKSPIPSFIVLDPHNEGEANRTTHGYSK